MYPNTQFIRGRPRHSQTQRSVESANKIVERKLAAMMHDTGQSDWYNMLDAVQHSMNHQVHSATKKKPYQLVFDRHPRPHVYPGLPVDDMILDEDHVRQHIVQLDDDDGQEAGQRLHRCSNKVMLFCVICDVICIACYIDHAVYASMSFHAMTCTCFCCSPVSTLQLYSDRHALLCVCTLSCMPAKVHFAIGRYAQLQCMCFRAE